MLDNVKEVIMCKLEKSFGWMSDWGTIRRDLCLTIDQSPTMALDREAMKDVFKRLKNVSYPKKKNWNYDEIRIPFMACYVLILEYRMGTRDPIDADAVLADYPTFVGTYGMNDEEVGYLSSFRYYMSLGLKLWEPANNKGGLMKVAGRLSGKYCITGGGQTPFTTRRVMIFEQEGDHKAKEIPQRRKRKPLGGLKDVDAELCVGLTGSSVSVPMSATSTHHPSTMEPNKKQCIGGSSAGLGQSMESDSSDNSEVLGKTSNGFETMPLMPDRVAPQTSFSLPFSLSQFSDGMLRLMDTIEPELPESRVDGISASTEFPSLPEGGLDAIEAQFEAVVAVDPLAVTAPYGLFPAERVPEFSCSASPAAASTCTRNTSTSTGATTTKVTFASNVPAPRQEQEQEQQQQQQRARLDNITWGTSQNYVIDETQELRGSHSFYHHQILPAVPLTAAIGAGDDDDDDDDDDENHYEEENGVDGGRAASTTMSGVEALKCTQDQDQSQDRDGSSPAPSPAALCPPSLVRVTTDEWKNAPFSTFSEDIRQFIP